MKRIMVLCLVMALLATMTIGVSATDTTTTPTLEGAKEWTPTDGKYTVTLNVGTPNAMFGFIAIPKDAEISKDTIVYIDQATSDASGVVTFTGFAPKDTYDVSGVATAWENCDLYVGGGNLTAANLAGTLAKAAATPTTVKITGTVTDSVAGTTKDATVTIVGAKDATKAYTATVAKGTTAFEVAVPVDDTYSVKVTKPSFLSYTIKGVPVVKADVAVGAIAILAGDVDGNGVVKLPDLKAVLGDYHKSEGFAYVTSDVDGNGVVKLPDLKAVLSGYHKGNVEVLYSK